MSRGPASGSSPVFLYAAVCRDGRILSEVVSEQVLPGNGDGDAARKLGRRMVSRKAPPGLHGLEKKVQ